MSSIYTIVQKRYLVRYGALEFSAYTMWFGTLFMIPFAWRLPATLRFGGSNRHQRERSCPATQRFFAPQTMDAAVEVPCGNHHKRLTHGLRLDIIFMPM